MAGLTDAGYEALRASDFLTLIRDRFEALTGLTPDWDRDTFLGQVTAIMAEMLGDLSEAGQAVYDAFDVGNATGIQLDNLALIVGVPRKQAGYSQATVTFSGTVGVVIPAGSLVEGGGDADDQRWETTDRVTIGAGGTVDVVVRATETGEIVASAGEIDKKITIISGLDSVTNAAAADPGAARETDEELRARRQASLQIAGAGSISAIRANVLALEYVQAAVVVDNDRGTVETVQGIVMQPHSIAVIVHPDSLTDAQKEEVASVIYDRLAIGIYTVGSDVVATLIGGDSGQKVIRYDFADEVSVDVDIAVTLAAGYDVADVEDDIDALVADYFLALSVGGSIYDLGIECLAASVAGVLRAEATFDISGGPSGVTSYTPAISELLIKGTTTVS